MLVLQFEIRINKTVVGWDRNFCVSRSHWREKNFAQNLSRVAFTGIWHLWWISLSFVFSYCSFEARTIRFPLIPHRGIDNVRAETCWGRSNRSCDSSYITNERVWEREVDAYMQRVVNVSQSEAFTDGKLADGQGGRAPWRSSYTVGQPQNSCSL